MSIHAPPNHSYCTPGSVREFRITRCSWSPVSWSRLSPLEEPRGNVPTGRGGEILPPIEVDFLVPCFQEADRGKPLGWLKPVSEGAHRTGHVGAVIRFRPHFGPRLHRPRRNRASQRDLVPGLLGPRAELPPALERFDPAELAGEPPRHRGGDVARGKPVEELLRLDPPELGHPVPLPLDDQVVLVSGQRHNSRRLWTCVETRRIGRLRSPILTGKSTRGEYHQPCAGRGRPEQGGRLCRHRDTAAHGLAPRADGGGGAGAIDPGKRAGADRVPYSKRNQRTVHPMTYARRDPADRFHAKHSR